MTKTKKICVAALLAALTGTAVAGVCSIESAKERTVFAEERAAVGYYGATLEDPLSQKFYAALSEMDFTTGENYSVTDPDILAAAAGFATGDSSLVDKFGAARDCFYYDHTEYFYVDIDQLSVNVARKGNGYTVDIGAGRTDSYFIKGVTAANLAGKIEEYNRELAQLIETVQGDLAERELTESNTGEKTWTYWNAYCANSAVTKNVEYGFCNTVDGKDTANSAFIRTAYGAAVVGECVCEGYARLYKAVMNGLGFDCELIYGCAVTPSGGAEPHMWTAVYDKTEECWYGVDPTWNDTTSYLAGGYLMVSGSVMECDHYPDKYISSSYYEMQYPALVKEDFGMASGKFSASYERKSSSDPLYLVITYDGKNSARLKTEGKYLAIRVKYGDVWGPWGTATGWGNALGNKNVFVDEGDVAKFNMSANGKVAGIEVGVFDAPDDEGASGKTHYSEAFAAAHLIEKSETISSPNYDAGFVAPPFVKNVTSYTLQGQVISSTWQSMKQDIAKGAHKIVVTYTQNMEKVDESAPVTVSVTASLAKNDKRTIDFNSVYEYTTVKNVQFEGNVISFEFSPSPMYQHNNIIYTFTVNNLQSLKANLGSGQLPVAPNGFRTAYAYADTYVCTKCLGGGRYLIDNAYSMPQLVNDGDLSTQGWSYTDDEGRKHMVSESQRSNLALVVTRPVESVKEETEREALKRVEAMGVTSESEVTSATYEIDLNICGKIVSIPNGSYLKINLGYPEGVDYAHLEGVVFKLYHFKRDASGKLDYAHPEEIECIFTPYGIVATVESFSPYTLVTIKNAPAALVEAEAAKKGITTQFNGIGGKVGSSTGKLTDTLVEGESITYTLYVEDGYEIEYAMLNGNAVKVVDGKATVKYEDMDESNIFSCGFVAKAVKEAEEDGGAENLLVKNLAYSEALAKDSTVNVGDLNLNLEQDIEGEAPSVAEYVPPTRPGGLDDEVVDDAKDVSLVIAAVVASVVGVLAITIAIIILVKRRAKRKQNGK